MDIITVTKAIYAKLVDEESQKIFNHRLLYSLTNDYRHVYEMAFLSFPAFKEFINKYDKIIVYGAGKFGQLFLKHYGHKVIVFCDSDEKKQGTYMNGVKVISINEIPMYLSNDVGCFVSVSAYSVCKKIKQALLDTGFLDEQIITSNSGESEYFNEDIINYTGNDVFVDGGCLDFSSSHEFIHYSGGRYDKIYAFEPNPKQYPLCVENAKKVKNAEVYPYGLWHKNDTLYFDNESTISSGAHITNTGSVKIETKKLDDFFNGKRVSFIKMDIEGAELNALKGAEELIKTCKPKLAISIYHKPQDIWEIPDYILSLNENYKLYLRHHTLNYPGTILFAV
ncbi:MAG: FkbM family methyltransferase [Defluviitaleaceae bacterium]|nr:FkbM family methyltransferase [Defluviitaleaceae bacterium]MCL2274420.1 FkbM family methyltransferase [Defluviitaleaceae bacterium]